MNRLVPLSASAVAACLVGTVAKAADPQTVTINDTLVYPESFDSLPDGTLFIGSSAKGTIYRALPGAAKADPWIMPRSDGMNSVLGVVTDKAAGLLWVCASNPAAPDHQAALESYDLQSGAWKASYAIPDSGRCNDTLITAGAVYPTDTPNGRVLKLQNGALSVWANDPLLKGIDGIAVGPNGGIYVNTVTTGHLYRIAVNADGSAGAITAIDTGQPLQGSDGMRSGPDGKLLLAENRAGHVDLVTIAGDKATTQIIHDGYQTPTAVTLVGNTVYVLESKFNYRSDPALKGKDPGDFNVYAVPLPAN